MGKEKEDKCCHEKIDLNIRVVPDGGWGWIISMAAFTVQFIILGLQNNLGLLHREYLNHFKRKNAETVWVCSLALGNMFLFAPITSALCEKFGCRRVGFCGGVLTVVGMLVSSFSPNLYLLYFTFGIVYGIGTSMCYFPTLRTLPFWFARNLALANGVAAAGSGVGTIAMGPLLQVILSATGWRNTLRILAGILLVPTLASLAYRLPQNKMNNEKDVDIPQPKRKIVDFSVLKNPAFLVLCIAVSMFMMGYFIPFVHLPGYAKVLNVEEYKSSNLVGIMSVGSTIGRLFFGKISDFPRVNRLYLYQMSFFFMGGLQFIVPQLKNFTGLSLYMGGFGLFDGCFVVLLAIVVSDVVGIDKVSTGMGVKFFFMAITTFVGTPFAAWLVDTSGSYDLAFYTAGASAILASLLLFLVPCLVPREVRIRNRMAFDVGIEEIAEDDSLNEKRLSFGGLPAIKTEDVSDPNSTDSSLLSPPPLAAQGSFLSVRSCNSIKSSPKSMLSIHSREPSLRASRLEVSCAVVGVDPRILPSDVVHRTKSTPNFLVVERMTTV